MLYFFIISIAVFALEKIVKAVQGERRVLNILGASFGVLSVVFYLLVELFTKEILGLSIPFVLFCLCFLLCVIIDFVLLLKNGMADFKTGWNSPDNETENELTGEADSEMFARIDNEITAETENELTGEADNEVLVETGSEILEK